LCGMPPSTVDIAAPFSGWLCHNGRREKMDRAPRRPARTTTDNVDIPWE
jgi:hypothetical protein